MKDCRRGYTLVEISLFLAVTAVIFVGIIVGTQNSIFQQRYTDAVQSFMDFLRNNYSQVLNVQSDGTGTTDDYVIYGRMITFNNDESNKIISYSIIGKDKEGENADMPMKKILNGDAWVGGYEAPEGGFRAAGLTEEYIPKWGSRIQVKSGSSFELFNGAIMIVRHPTSGTVYTYVAKNDSVNYRDVIDERKFKQSELDLCVNPNGTADSDFRKDVRIDYPIGNSSGVFLVPDDSTGNKCK